MKLLTKEVQKNLPSLYSQEGVTDAVVRLKMFNPCGAATWYITEGSPVDENGTYVLGENGVKVEYNPAIHSDFLFFGLCDLGYGGELGYVSLSELQSLRLPFGLGIERDLHFLPAPLSKFSRD